MRLILTALALAALAGCAPPQPNIRAQLDAIEQRDRDRAQMNAYIESACAYAKSDPMKYGDCQRETRMQLYQLNMQQLMITNQAIKQQADQEAAPNKAMADAIRQYGETRYRNQTTRTNCVKIGDEVNCTSTGPSR